MKKQTREGRKEAVLYPEKYSVWLAGETRHVPPCR